MRSGLLVTSFTNAKIRPSTSWKCMGLAMLCCASLSCAAAKSEYMTPAAGPPRGPVAEKAVVLFASDIELGLGSQVLTIYDENKQFLGELVDHSMFEVELAPGKHGFAAIDLRGANKSVQLPCGQAFTTELEAGKIYLAWIRFGDPEHQPNNQPDIVPLRWIFARPDAKLLDPTDLMKVWRNNKTFPQSKPFFQSDRARGQAFLDGFGASLCVPPADPGAKGVDLPARFGFDHLPQ